ncbi:MAG: type II toxin-antitoxin system HicB family antitoxin [Nitrosarchaeum sp.]
MKQVTGSTIVIPKVDDAPTKSTVEIYQVILKQDEDGRFVATVPSLPGVVTDGTTEDEALENVSYAINDMLDAQGLRKEFMIMTTT